MVFEDVRPEIKEKIVSSWKHMSETDKQHFINQVSLALSICGSEPPCKKMVSDVIAALIAEGSMNLADFGLYVESVPNDAYAPILSKIRRAALVIEGYRIKHAMPSEPTRSIM